QSRPPLAVEAGGHGGTGRHDLEPVAPAPRQARRDPVGGQGPKERERRVARAVLERRNDNAPRIERRAALPPEDKPAGDEDRGDASRQRDLPAAGEKPGPALELILHRSERRGEGVDARAAGLRKRAAPT